MSCQRMKGGGCSFKASFKIIKVFSVLEKLKKLMGVKDVEGLVGLAEWLYASFFGKCRESRGVANVDMDMSNVQWR
uniref:HDC19911 n=1 Tax=Drosophila melanogaster TaxID=7227 RepID=Q6II30_DROME|nr:TPA_inf: HDC19911 [Drosophila melanogaster]